MFKKKEFLLQQKYEYTHLESKSNPHSLYYMYWLDVLVYDLAERSQKMIFQNFMECLEWFLDNDFQPFSRKIKFPQLCYELTKRQRELSSSFAT